MIQKSMENRKLENLHRKFVPPSYHFNLRNEIEPTALCILCSSSDVGVRRNGGRNGARFAPKSILNSLLKLNDHSNVEKITLMEIAENEEEKKDFTNAQRIQAQKIVKFLKHNSHPIKIHLGGGHDHIYPLLHGIYDSKLYENLLIINIDAHCDTRTDSRPHSGTPFRNFDADAPTNTTLYQYGIHRFSNSRSTLSPLKNIATKYFYYPKLKKDTDNFQTMPQDLLKEIAEVLSSNKTTKKTALVLSLDCDAIGSEQMAAVSAPNPQGIPLGHIQDFLNEINEITQQTKQADLFFGVYEFNPVFDELSAIGAKRIASLIWSLLK